MHRTVKLNLFLFLIYRLTMTTTRILAHFRHQSEVVLGDFSTCIVDLLRDSSNKTEDEDSVPVKCLLEDGKFIISAASQEEIQSGNKDVGLIRHPPFCPIRMMTPEDIQDLHPDMKARGINVGICAVVESRDKRVLVTRRAAHMRTFPGVWVPPGGGLDAHDPSLKEAALRELEEETGLSLNPKICRRSRILCLWESVYPPRLDWGLPGRHHVVVYYHFRLNEDYKVLNGKLNLEPEEVDASAWLCAAHIDLVVNGVEEGQKVEPETFTMKVIDREEKVAKDIECSSEILMAKAPKKINSGQDIQRISSGTRFALAQWLQTCTNNNKL